MLSCDKHIIIMIFITCCVCYDNVSNTTGSSQYSVSHLTTGINTHVTSSSCIMMCVLEKRLCVYQKVKRGVFGGVMLLSIIYNDIHSLIYLTRCYM